MDFQLIGATAIGVIVSAVTEFLKVFPYFGKDSKRKRVTALVLSILGAAYFSYTYGYLDFTAWDISVILGSILWIVGSSYLVYQSIIKTFTDK